MKQLTNGIFPTMLVLYNKENKIDYKGMKALIEWYIKKGVHGIFALCHSTEIHKLTVDEKTELAAFVMKTVAGRVPVVMAGATEDSLDDQLATANKIIEAAHPDAFVFLRNRLGDDFETFKNRLDYLIDKLPADVSLGLYECPFPYKQWLTDEELAYTVKTERFVFLKDTCCNVEIMKRRAAIVKGTSFKLYNANCATYYEMINHGYSGFSGIGANFHPDLYAFIANNLRDPRCEFIDKVIGVSSVIECRCYPICAKKYLNMFEGFNVCETSRVIEDTTIPALSAELEGINHLTNYCRELIAGK